MIEIIKIYRGDTVIHEFVPDDSFSRPWGLMSDNYINVTLKAKENISLLYGDYILLNGERFTLFNTVNIAEADGIKEYPLTFYGEQYFANRCIVEDEGATTFSYFGGVSDHMTLVKLALDKYGLSRFTLGRIEENGSQLIEYDNTKGLDAINKICETFKMEWEFTGDVINIKKRVGVDTSYRFEYGKGKGAYSVSLQPVQNTSIATRVIAKGGTINLPKNYPSTDNPKRLNLGSELLDRNTDKYGIIPEVMINEDVYPRLIDKKVLDVDIPADIENTETWKIKLDIPFDLAAQYAPDQKPEVKFQTGDLTGNSFEIVENSWNNEDKTLQIIVLDQDGYKLPSKNRQPRIGDGFVLLNILMPEDPYVTDATNELRKWGEAQLKIVSEPQFAPSVSVTPDYIRTNDIQLHPGDGIVIVAGGNEIHIRIQKITFPLTNKHELTLELGNNIMYSYAEKIANDLQDITNEVQNIRRNVQNVDRRGWRVAKETNERLGGIEESAALIGTEGGQLTFSGMFQANVNSNPNSFLASEGRLQHFIYKDNPAGGIWNIGAFNITLQENVLYNIYAKCNKSSTNGIIYISKDKIDIEAEGGYYYFFLGTISSIFEEVRSVILVTGYTFITGGYLTGQVLQDAQGHLVIDMPNATITARQGAKIRGKIEFQSIDEAYVDVGESIVDVSKQAADAQNAAEEAARKAQETQNYIDNALRQELDQLHDQADGLVERWDGNYIPSLSNYPANQWATEEEKQRHVDDTFTKNSGSEEYLGNSWKWSNVGGVWQWVLIADTALSAALLQSSEAKDIARTKTRNFVVTPYPPYEVGDMWSQGPAGDMMRCTTSRLSGSYVASDWTKASKYTDDTVANQAVARLTAMSNDGIISKEEKATLRNDKAQIDKEFTKYQQDANQYSVPITTLQAAYTSLVNFLLDVVKINENTDFTFGSGQQATYNQNFADYYAARTDFANLIADKIAAGAVGNIRIGGENIVSGTGTFMGETMPNYEGFGGLQSATFRGNAVYQTTKDWQGFYFERDATTEPTIVSFYARKISGYPMASSVVNRNYNAILSITNDDWQQYYFFFESGANLKNSIREGVVEFYQGIVQYSSPKVEFGNKATAWSPSLLDQKQQSIELAQDEINNLQIGSVNLISKKMMLKWNQKNTSTATWGQDKDGVYLRISPSLLYSNVANRNEQRPIFDISFKEKTQYVLSVEWKTETTEVAPRYGIVIFIYYTDGTNRQIRLYGDVTFKTRENVVTEKNRTVSKISASYNHDVGALIYNISLIEGNKILNGFPVAQEDNTGANNVNLISNSQSLTIPVLSANYNYKHFTLHIKPNTIYTVSFSRLEVLAGSVTSCTFAIFNIADSVNIAGVQLALGNDNKNGIFIIPANIEEQDAHLLVYAGIAGSTSGNSVRFTDITLVEGILPATTWQPSAADQERIAQAAAKLAETESKAYADGIVTAEEERAIKDAQDKYNRAINIAQQNSLAQSWGSGRMLATDPTFKTGINSIRVYNNYGNGNVIISKISKQSDSPVADSDYNIEIKNIGAANPNLGGFSFGNASRASAIFIYRFIAKIPLGYYIVFNTNPTGDGSTHFWTKYIGTGKFEEYICVAKCGTSGTFSSTGFFSLVGTAGTPSNPVKWYLAYASVFDITSSVNGQTLAIDANNKAVAAQNAANNAVLDAAAAQRAADAAELAADIAAGNASEALTAAQNVGFLSAAFAADDTTISGGVVLSSFIGVKNNNNVVVAGIVNGKNPVAANLMIFAGASSASAMGSAAFRVYADGTLYANKCNLIGNLETSSGNTKISISANDNCMKFSYAGKEVGRLGFNVNVGSAIPSLSLNEGSSNLTISGHRMIMFDNVANKPIWKLSETGDMLVSGQLSYKQNTVYSYNNMYLDNTESGTYIILSADYNSNIYLPSSPKQGHFYMMRNCNGRYKGIIHGNGHKIIFKTLNDARYDTDNLTNAFVFIYKWDHANGIWYRNYLEY